MAHINIHVSKSHSQQFEEYFILVEVLIYAG